MSKFINWCNKLAKKLSWVDIKIVGLVGVAIGMIVAEFWKPNIWVPIVVAAVGYLYVGYKLFIKK